MKAGDISIEGKKVYYIHNGVLKKPSVVFLHGKKFNAKIWVDSTAMKALANAGYSAISVNLPNFNNTSYDTDLWPDIWLFECMNRLKLTRPIFIAASTASEYVVPFMVNNPKRISGLIGVGLTNLKKYANDYSKVLAPVLAISGEKDKIVPPSDSQIFAQAVTNGEYKTIAEAGHSPYLDKPEEFNKMVVEFLKTKCKF